MGLKLAALTKLRSAGSESVSLLIIFKRKFKLCMLLVVTVFLSIVFESIGFGMILPLLEKLVGSQSESLLGDLFLSFYDYLGLEMNLVNVILLFAIIMFIKNLLIIFREGLRSYFAYSFKKEAMLGINESLFSMEYERFLQERQGHIINDTITETQHATLVLLQGVELITSIVAIIAFIIVMFLADPFVTGALVMIAFVFIGGSKIVFGNYSRKVGLREVNLNQIITDHLAESITLMRDFRLYQLDGFHLKRMRKALDDFVRLLVKWDVMTASIAPMIELIIVLTLSFYIFYLTLVGESGAFLDKLPSIGVILVLSHRLLQRASRVSINILSVTKYLPSLFTVIRYYDLHQGLIAEGQKVDFSQNITCEDISVNQKDGGSILVNSNLVIKSGKVTALIGKTGSGKSTLVDFIVGLRVPHKGNVLIGDVNIREIDHHILRSKISVISQSGVLMNDSILNNIRAGSLVSSDSEVYEICRSLQIHDFIESLPLGYDTMVGDRGSLLSGGQVQRILIARALIRHPEVLVMDEATSALDDETEELINERVMKEMAGKTVIVVTHRSSILKYCDEVFKINNSKLIRVTKDA